MRTGLFFLPLFRPLRISNGMSWFVYTDPITEQVWKTNKNKHTHITCTSYFIIERLIGKKYIDRELRVHNPTQFVHTCYSRTIKPLENRCIKIESNREGDRWRRANAHTEIWKGLPNRRATTRKKDKLGTTHGIWYADMRCVNSM